MTRLTDEQLGIRELARDFALRELRPHAEHWDAAGEIPDEALASMAEMGFLGLRVPEAHGGLALDLPTALLAVEAMAWGESAVGLTLSVHAGPVTRALLRWATEAQQAGWLPGVADGTVRTALALSETGAGSDVGAMAARAERQGEGWRLTGEKRWVTGGDRAGLVLVWARSSGEPGSLDGLTAFLVPGDAPGLRVKGRERTLGMSASSTVTLELDGVELPAEAVLGPVDQGWAVARDALVHGRLFVAAVALGIAQAALEHAVRYAGERSQFGRTLDQFGAIQEKLAGMALRTSQVRAHLLEVAERVDRAGEDTASTGSGGVSAPASLAGQAALAKVAASEAATWCADEAVQIFGGYGYMRDYPVEKLMRDAKGTEIFEGSNEILRWIVARDLVQEAGGG